MNPILKKFSPAALKGWGGCRPPRPPRFYPWGGTGGVVQLLGPPWGRQRARQLAAADRNVLSKMRFKGGKRVSEKANASSSRFRDFPCGSCSMHFSLVLSLVPRNAMWSRSRFVWSNWSSTATPRLFYALSSLVAQRVARAPRACRRGCCPRAATARSSVLAKGASAQSATRGPAPELLATRA